MHTRLLAPGIDDPHPAGTWFRREEAEPTLQSLRAALDRLAITATTDRAGRILEVNDLFCRVSGYSRDEILGQSHRILNSGFHAPDFFDRMWRTISSGNAWHEEICNRAKNGSLYWVDTTIVPRRDGQGRLHGYLSIRYDITKRKQAEAALKEENARREKAEFLLRDVIEALPNGVSAFDADDRLILFNSAFKQSHPLAAPAIAEGATFESIVRHGLDRGQFPQAGQTEESREAWLRRRMQRHRNPGHRPVIHQINDGRWFQVQERMSKGGHHVGVRTDITRVKTAESVIKEQAERDPLTGLFNRRVVMERLKKTLRRGQAASQPGALVLADLDNFKSINDRFGHDAGDRVLLHVAKHFQSVLRKSDIVARLGGDEFAVILCGVTSEKEAATIARKLLNGVRVPMKIGAKTVVPSASFGIALFPQHGTKPVDLMKHADMALYEAKRNGRTTYATFTPSLRRDLQRRSVLVDAIRNAIEEDQLDIALQPQVSVATRRHIGFEALLRWRLNGEPVSPAETVLLAEETGLIVPLGEQVIRKAFFAIRKMRADGLEPGSVAINVAAAQLREPTFAKTFLEAIRFHELNPRNVEVEVTENVVLDRASDSIQNTLCELNGSGVQIALDDFGTGYASLSHLKRFPIARLKIDRSFVKDLSSNDDDAIITRTIISLAHSLEIRVIAEGVETLDQFGLLSNYGCDHVQGYFFGHPMSPADAEGYLQRIRALDHQAWDEACTDGH